MTKPWPLVPLLPVNSLDLGTGCWTYGFIEVPPTTSCKHGAGACEDCGTTDRRDVVHTTRGGRGAVGRIKRRGR